MKWCCRYSYQHCTKLFPVSESLLETENDYAFEVRKQIGLYKSFPSHNFQYTIVSNGFDSGFWSRRNEAKQAYTFLTVSGANGFHLKGLDLIFQAASHFKDYTFYVAGIGQIPGAPENVNFLGFLNKEQLRQAYSKAQFYLQLSVWEGFGCALCEAMLCEAIPIVSNVNVLPQLAGEKGYVLTKRNVEDLKKVIEKAVTNVELDGSYFRKHISDNYAIEDRIEQLIQLIYS